MRPLENVIFPRHVCCVTQATGYVTTCEHFCCSDPECVFKVKQHSGKHVCGFVALSLQGVVPTDRSVQVSVCFTLSGSDLELAQLSLFRREMLLSLICG